MLSEGWGSPVFVREPRCLLQATEHPSDSQAKAESRAFSTLQISVPVEFTRRFPTAHNPSAAVFCAAKW